MKKKRNIKTARGRLQRLVRSLSPIRDTTSIPFANRLLKKGWMLVGVTPLHGKGKFVCSLAKPTDATVALLDAMAKQGELERGTHLDRLLLSQPPGFWRQL